MAAQIPALGAGVTAFSARELTLRNTVSAPGYAALDVQAAYDFAYAATLSQACLQSSQAFSQSRQTGCCSCL